jgi:hypothetical protein
MILLQGNMTTSNAGRRADAKTCFVTASQLRSRGNLRRTHVARMTKFVKANEIADPLTARVLGFTTVVQRAYRIWRPVHQRGWPFRPLPWLEGCINIQIYLSRLKTTGQAVCALKCSIYAVEAVKSFRCAGRSRSNRDGFRCRIAFDLLLSSAGTTS